MIILSIFITVIVIFVVRLYIKLSQKYADVDGCSMEGKTVIVTGGTNGIGRATVKLLAEKRSRVIIACRNLDKGAIIRNEIVSETGNSNVIVKQLDLASLSSVRSFAEVVIKEERRLDVLINNAGILAPGTKTITEDGLEMTYATNHFGHFLLTNLLLDLLKKSSPSRIINVSSIVYSMGSIDFDNLNSEKSYPSFQLYQHTKLANVLFTRELSKRLEGTGVTANCLHPGTIYTSLLEHRLHLRIIATIFGPLFWKTPEVGAQTSLHLAVSDKVQGVSGRYYDNCREATLSANARDDAVGRKLWEVSERLTGLQQ